MRIKNHYLVTTAHLESGLWFVQEEDFPIGMNYVAIQAFCSNISIEAFILMSNHVHFILYGKNSSVNDFINGFKCRYSKFLRQKYGQKEFLRNNDVDIQTIYEEKESLERAIAYVQMNCVAANICSHPTQYLWGTGNAFFNTMPLTGDLLGEMSFRRIRNLLRSSNQTLPSEWIINGYGFIDPRSFVDVESVESLYRTPQRMNYFLNSSSKAKRILTTDDNRPTFRDQIITSASFDIISSLFRKTNFLELTEQEKTEYLRQLKFRFCANINQMARITGMTYGEVTRLLDNVTT